MSSSPTEATMVEISMPQMGVSVAEGTIVEWRKRPGDWVEADEPICDISTDKIDVEIPSPAAGRLLGLSEQQIGHAMAMAAVSDASFAVVRAKPLSQWKGLA